MPCTWQPFPSPLVSSSSPFCRHPHLQFIFFVQSSNTRRHRAPKPFIFLFLPLPVTFSFSSPSISIIITIINRTVTRHQGRQLIGRCGSHSKGWRRCSGAIKGTRGKVEPEESSSFWGFISISFVKNLSKLFQLGFRSRIIILRISVVYFGFHSSSKFQSLLALCYQITQALLRISLGIVWLQFDSTIPVLCPFACSISEWREG